jgi:hypothetical protein
MIITLPMLPKKTVPAVVVWSAQVLEKLKAFLSANNRLMPGVYCMDKMYNLYTCANIHKVRIWAAREMYSAPTESADCDNSAEHYSYWLHRALWGSAVVQVTGLDVALKKAHRFCLVVGSDGIVEINDMGHWFKLSKGIM